MTLLPRNVELRPAGRRPTCPREILSAHDVGDLT